MSGVNVASINVTFDKIHPWYEGMKILSVFRDWILARPDAFLLISSSSDVRVAQSTGRLGVFFDVEGMDALDGQLSMVRTYYDLGVRWMLVAYNQNNLAGGGCMDDDQGLTAFGHDVLREMKQVGMLVCCSHTGDRTSRDVIEAAEMPVLFTHANPSALVDHPRCISDDLMRACASTGGVVGIVGYGSFLMNGDTSAANIFRHIDYVVQLLGADHVGFSSDYVFDEDELMGFLTKGKVSFVSGEPASESTNVRSNPAIPQMFAPEDFPSLTEEMLKAGYNESTVRGILGENWFRVCQQVWK